MDNNSSSDDEIELLNLPALDDKGVEDEPFVNHSVNPAFNLLRRDSWEDNSINPASVHALQTACTSLQQKLKDKNKKYNEILQKNKLMQKALFDMNKQGHMRQAGVMDDLCPQDVHAAGAGACSPEDEGMVAEQRARQGYISHLEREVLRNTTAISRGNEEITRLKRMLDDRDREKKGLLQRVEQLQTEIDITARTYNEDIIASQRKIEELEKKHQLLFQENSTLKDRIDFLEKSPAKDTEIKDLKSKLTVADQEMTKLTRQFRDLDRRSQEKEDEVSRLKAQCNQFEIEADINKKYRASEGRDEVDGDAELYRALDMIKSQRTEVTSLLQQVQQQKTVIKELLIANERDTQPVNKGPGSTKEERGRAQGASMSHHYENESNFGNHGNAAFTNIAPVQEQVSSQLRQERSPIARRQSDRSEYRSMNRPPLPTSPRLREQFVTTGNTRIPEMLANEDPRLPRRTVGSSNVFDASAAGSRLSPRSQTQSPQPLYMNVATATCSPPGTIRRDAGLNVMVESPNSPRSRLEHSRNVEPTPAPTFSPQLPTVSNANNGARPKQNYCQDDLLQTHQFFENIHAPNKIPDRMTQSAILLRDDGQTDNNAMSRSMYSPNSPIEVSNHTSPERNDFARTVQEPVWIRPENLQEPGYGNNYRAAEAGPDYENIVNIKPHSSVRRQVEEHDDTVFANDVNVISPTGGRTVESNTATDPTADINRVDSAEVSALKICPVCNLEYSRLTMDQFQTHVFECFDNCEEPTTLQPVAAASDEDRNCPMCTEVFPLTIPQEAFEQHVLAHFGEEPAMDRFEIINS